jgi:hypothetical protein
MQNRGHQGGVADGVFVQRSHQLARVERGEDGQAGAPMLGCERAPDHTGVTQRRRDQAALARQAPVGECSDLGAVGGDGAVGEDRAFGAACGAAGVELIEIIVRGHGTCWRRGGLALRQCRQADPAGGVALVQGGERSDRGQATRQRFHRGPMGGIGNDNCCPRVADRVEPLRRRGPVVQRDRHYTGGARRVVQQQVLDGVLGQDRDPFSDVEVQRGEDVRQPVRPFPSFGPGHAARILDGELTLGRLLGPPFQLVV